MTPGSIEDFLPFSTNGVAIASDGSVWLYHPPTPGGLVEVLAPVVPTPPVNTTPPTIQAISDLVVGSQAAVVSNGVWENSPTFTRQWLSGSAAVGTGTVSYTFVTADIGAMITCRLTGTNEDGSATAVSNAIGPIVGATEDPPPVEPESLPTLRQTATLPPRSHHAKPQAKPPRRRY
jgi:hypothetical protein